MMLAEVALFPKQASTVALEVDKLFYFLVSICGAVGLMVAFLLILFSVRYRRSRQPAAPPKTDAHPALEWFWTLTPLVIFMVMFMWGAEVYVDAYRPPDNALRIYGVGKQWMWKFQHSEGQREINSLHVPLGQPVQILLISEDVIHSFFVPAFRTHMDVLPNRYTSVWFQATEAGTYHLFCSQYCGTNHAGMVGQVVVMPPADFERWLQFGADGSLAQQGRQVFLKYRCLSCHTGREDARAPVLEELFGKAVPLADGRAAIADEAYLRESILNPGAKIVAGWQNIMPTFQGQITEEEILALVAYFQSLKHGETPPRVEDYPPPASTPAVSNRTVPQ
jgi:cytochrome c oxidase subunit 2